MLTAKDAATMNAATMNKEEARSEVIKETADLWFHSLVMLSHLNIDTNELLLELNSRFGTSGLVEKAARGN